MIHTSKKTSFIYAYLKIFLSSLLCAFNIIPLLGSPCSYYIDQGVCYLVLSEASFPKKLAFAYLEDLQAEFHEQHGKKVQTVSRPYSFIEFGKTQKTTMKVLLTVYVNLLSQF